MLLLGLLTISSSSLAMSELHTETDKKLELYYTEQDGNSFISISRNAVKCNAIVKNNTIIMPLL